MNFFRSEVGRGATDSLLAEEDCGPTSARTEKKRILGGSPDDFESMLTAESQNDKRKSMGTQQHHTLMVKRVWHIPDGWKFGSYQGKLKIGCSDKRQVDRKIICFHRKKIEGESLLKKKKN